MEVAVSCYCDGLMFISEGILAQFCRSRGRALNINGRSVRVNRDELEMEVDPMRLSGMERA